MKLFILALAVLGLTAGATRASAQTTIQPACNQLQIDRLVGSVSLRLSVDRAVIPAMSCLLSLWREDKGGSTKFAVSNAFLTIMEQNPRAFFSIMANEPIVFSEWLNRLADLTFTWPFDPPCQLETRRLHLISVLENSKVDSGKASSLKDSVVAKLSALRCRQLN
jgi:hypothetical protein